MGKRGSSASTPAKPGWRSRVKELRHVRAGDLKGAPFNWRTHPEAQRAAVVESLEELGWFDPLDVRELPDGSLELIDGHLRQDLAARVGPDTLIPVVVTDLSDAEAKKANLLKDPLGQLAEANAGKLDALLGEVGVKNEALAGLLDEMRGTASGATLQDADGGEAAGAKDGGRPGLSSPQIIRVVLYFNQVALFEEALSATGLMNRADALAAACRGYLDAKRQ